MRLQHRLHHIRRVFRRRRELLPRRWFYRVAGRFTPIVAARSGHGLVLVTTADSSFSPGLFEHGRRKEYRILKLALNSLEEAGHPAGTGVFVDVGAHVGTTTLAALDAGFRSCIAIEPSPKTCRLLRANVALNGAHDRVTVIETAVSNIPGTAILGLDKGSPSKNRLVRPGEARGATIEVEQMTLDQLVASGHVDDATVGFLWMDVEGSEPQVLLGASSLLERGVPIVAEVNPKVGGPDVAREMLAAVDRHYTHVRDFGPLSSGRFEPVADLAIADRYREHRKFTDVLFVRL